VMENYRSPYMLPVSKTLQVLRLMRKDCSVTVEIMSLAIGLDKAKTRRILDKLVKQGKLGKHQVSFWNGMHYAKRNYYWMVAKK